MVDTAFAVSTTAIVGARAGVGGDLVVGLSAVSHLKTPTSLAPDPLSQTSAAMLPLASAVVAFGLCHSAGEGEGVPQAGVSDTVAK